VEQEATLVEIRELESEYEILGELGRGGMAVVYLARDRQLGRQVAIKVIHAAAGADEAAVSRQLGEARTVAQLQHPNVVAIYAVRRLSTLGLALVMQYIPGRTLERAMREDGCFPPERTEAVLGDVAAALSYAHARGVVHRDIKPDNIFLNDETGRALVSDFGIALSAEAARHETNDVIVGTPAYMSPEQIDGLVLDGRSDLFSLGLVGYEMLAGVRPWVDENISDVMYRQKFEALPALVEQRPEVPDRLRVAIERSVMKSRDDRWPSAAAFLAALTDDEWVPSERDAAGRSATQNRLGAQLGARAASGPAPSGAPLETMQYRREGVPTPRKGIPARHFAPRRRSRRVPAILLSVVLLAGGATAVVMTHPGLLSQRSRLRVPWAPNDSAARDDAATISALRDSTARAILAAEVAQHAADSAANAAVSGSDSQAALRLAAVRDSLAKAAEDAKKAQVVSPNAAGDQASSAKARAAAKDSSAASRDSQVAPPPPPEPAPIHPPSSPTLVAGGTHSCALAADGTISCWGANDRGQLGTSGAVRKAAPSRIDADVSFAQVTAGISDACAIARSGAAYCWGDNTYGQLGDSTTGTQPTPMRVIGNHTFRDIATGTAHSCALTSAGEVWCWGRNLYGELGNGSTQDQASPVRVESPAHFVALTVGWNHSCALDETGHAFCWGQNSFGQLGDGTTIVRTVPASVAGGLLFRAIAAGGSQTCALTTEGVAYCWGRNATGQLGTGDQHSQQVPTKVATPLTFVTITAGGVHSCAITAAGEAWCWGRNSYGQLGDGTTADRMTPVKVLGGLAFVAIHASGAHTCATTTAGSLYCWGDNSDGQLGDGTTSDRSEPVPVIGAR
jgi:alpha-tubulin suppressor-like RCC1 family protein/serine/threonine protein kinase